MAKYFNVAGPCDPRQHYMIAGDRCTGDIAGLIEMGQYFVLHAARQTGKTTLLLDLYRKFNSAGKYHALYCSLEAVQNVADPQEGIPAIVALLRNALHRSKMPGWEDFAAGANINSPLSVLNEALAGYCEALDKPLVIFFDEADCLSEGTLISFLRQLRDGYVTRSIAPFVHAVALVGMRNIRDFKARIRPDSQTLGSASPFNIIADAFTLHNFTEEEIQALYRQHTAETGQRFEDDAVTLVWKETQGQPWLVNAIAREIVEKMLDSDYTKTVTADMVETAIQTLILRRDTHVDSLMERLKEERVRNIIQPLLLGDNNIDVMSSDFLYTRDLGLIRVTDDKAIIPANPVYAEVMVRDINVNTQNELTRNKTYQMPRYIKSGKIDIDFLLKDFQAFWRENSAMWIEHYQYKEAAPHLVLQAFLQRVINGGGDIIREMAIGAARRADICVTCQGYKYPLELKILRGQKTYREGLEQTAAYMDSLGCAEVWLIVFDRTPRKSWTKKIFMRKESFDGKKIIIVGC